MLVLVLVLVPRGLSSTATDCICKGASRLPHGGGSGRCYLKHKGCETCFCLRQPGIDRIQGTLNVWAACHMAATPPNLVSLQPRPLSPGALRGELAASSHETAILGALAQAHPTQSSRRPRFRYHPLTIYVGDVLFSPACV